MKATGVVRRIDDLGRIVIPKEIRKNLRIKNGENFEIFLDEEEHIILKKYSQIDKLKDVATSLADAIYSLIKKDIFITNTDTFIAIGGHLKKEYLNKPLSGQIEKAIHSRQEVIESEINSLDISAEKTIKASYALCPIIAGGDAVGSLILISTKEALQDPDFQIIKLAANFLARHIEQ